MGGDNSIRFSQELFDSICERIAAGESLRAICTECEMPGKSTVFQWLANSEDLADQYAHAREIQADTLFDDCLSIADQYDAAEKTMDGGTDHIQRAKLRIDTRKWMAGKLRPKKYGDKIVVGGDKDMDPIKTEEIGTGAAKVLAALETIAERSGTSGEPDAE